VSQCQRRRLVDRAGIVKAFQGDEETVTALSVAALAEELMFRLAQNSHFARTAV
jgi:hypothetical protein